MKLFLVFYLIVNCLLADAFAEFEPTVQAVSSQMADGSTNYVFSVLNNHKDDHLISSITFIFNKKNKLFDITVPPKWHLDYDLSGDDSILWDILSPSDYLSTRTKAIFSFKSFAQFDSIKYEIVGLPRDGSFDLIIAHGVVIIESK